MRNRELIEKFMNENFDLASFDINWQNDWLVDLTDKKGDKITICTAFATEIWTMINGVKYLKYRLKNCYCGSYWVVVND